MGVSAEQGAERPEQCARKRRRTGETRPAATVTPPSTARARFRRTSRWPGQGPRAPAQCTVSGPRTATACRTTRATPEKQPARRGAARKGPVRGRLGGRRRRCAVSAKLRQGENMVDIGQRFEGQTMRVSRWGHACPYTSSMARRRSHGSLAAPAPVPSTRPRTTRWRPSSTTRGSSRCWACRRFALGISFGPMLPGLLSEYYGRRPIYLVAWTTYLAWLVPQAVARNMAVMLVFRFPDGASGSTVLAVSGGTVGDLFSSSEPQAPMAPFSVWPFIGPGIGSLLGGFINHNSDWRWTYRVLIIWSLALWVAIFLVPETYHPILPRNKERGLRVETGDDQGMAPGERAKKPVGRAVGRSLPRPFQLLIFGLPLLGAAARHAVSLLRASPPSSAPTTASTHGRRAWRS
ncbi:drug/proton antiporter YHK8 [Tolypocladium capitatum]|uniref:Drug/proton antiporter YHK8 n=1 Tax=Tolypocladium capitatum TaxID=45235 RepID=A0A2K3QKY4_9HYPO|nr:drug/proton antiporter YHK8 [Tolypocladium capitatum]